MQTNKRKRMRKFGREALEQYRALGREIAQLERELGKRRRVADTVRASSAEAPYLAHTVTIVGDDTRLRERLERRRRRARRQRAAIEAYVDAIEDSQLRQIIRLRYMQGLTWIRVAACMGCATPDSVRKSANRYISGD